MVSSSRTEDFLDNSHVKVVQNHLSVRVFWARELIAGGGERGMVGPLYRDGLISSLANATPNL